MREDQANMALNQNSQHSADYNDRLDTASTAGSTVTEEKDLGNDEDADDMDERDAEDDDTFNIPTTDTYDDLSPSGSAKGTVRFGLGGQNFLGIAVSFSDDQADPISRSGTGSVTSSASRASVASLIAIKRERIERQRRESVQMSSSFTESSKNDSKVDKNRTLTMIKGRTPKHAESHE